MTNYIETASELIGATTPFGVEDVELPSGWTVVVRGLTRDEHLWIGKGTDDAATIEARMISKAMVQPIMTIEEVRQWQRTAGTLTLKTVSDKIRDLSGFGEGATKSDVVEVRD